jgi:hypothetical protein
MKPSRLPMPARLTGALATFAITLALAPAARAQEPAAAPTTTVVTTATPTEDHSPPPSVRGKLILGGIIVSGAAYGAALTAGLLAPERRNDNALISGIPGSSNLKIPFAGPWVTLAKAECVKPTLPGSTGCDAGTYIGDVLLVVDGLVQAAGVSFIIEALVMKTESSPAPKPALAFGLPLGVTVRPIPVATTRFTGLGLVGTF